MISVIVPAYNEEKGIVKAINSMLPQLSNEDEVIVVSSGSTDNTISEVQKIPDSRVRLVIQKERKGKASAINLAVSRAKGDIIVQTDSDVEVDDEAIKPLLKPFENPKIVAVSGHPIPVIPEDNIFYEWTKMSYNRIHDLRIRDMEEKDFWHLSGYLLAFRKDAMDEIPFAKGAVDAIMSVMLKSKGNLLYVPNAIVYVRAPTNMKDFIAQKARVRAGYVALPKMPRSVGSEISYFPKAFWKVPWSRKHKFIYSAFVYLYAWIKGWWMAKTNKSLQEIWTTPESTK